MWADLWKSKEKATPTNRDDQKHVEILEKLESCKYENAKLPAPNIVKRNFDTCGQLKWPNSHFEVAWKQSNVQDMVKCWLRCVSI